MWVPEPHSSGPIRLPIKIVQGQIKQLDGSDLPKLDDSRFGELVLYPSALKDKELRDKLTQTHTARLLPAGTEVYFVMRPQNREIQKGMLLRPEDWPHPEKWLDKYLARVILVEDLSIEYTETSKGRLSACKCNVPALELGTLSLNIAYTALSEEFEPHRSSHTGSVYTLGWTKIDQKWTRLDDLRQHVIFGHVSKE